MAGELGVLNALDVAKTQLYHFTTIVIAGMGFFTDAYDLFCISLVTKLLRRIYYTVPNALKDWWSIDILLGTWDGTGIAPRHEGMARTCLGHGTGVAQELWHRASDSSGMLRTLAARSACYKSAYQFHLSSLVMWHFLKHLIMVQVNSHV